MSTHAGICMNCKGPCDHWSTICERCQLTWPEFLEAFKKRHPIPGEPGWPIDQEGWNK